VQNIVILEGFWKQSAEGNIGTCGEYYEEGKEARRVGTPSNIMNPLCHETKR